ncbi:hypothetical protein F5888DRAFT_1886653 [Russula emetica]|nr:hypothetical protein F5888DRAFT_1886653 [Russula emetica]
MSPLSFSSPIFRNSYRVNYSGHPIDGRSSGTPCTSSLRTIALPWSIAKLSRLTYRIGTHPSLLYLLSMNADWVLDDGAFDNDRGHFRRNGPPVNHDNRVPPELPQWQSQSMTTSKGGLSSGTHGLEPLISSEKVIAFKFGRVREGKEIKDLKGGKGRTCVGSFARANFQRPQVKRAEREKKVGKGTVTRARRRPEQSKLKEDRTLDRIKKWSSPRPTNPSLHAQPCYPPYSRHTGSNMRSHHGRLLRPGDICRGNLKVAPRFRDGAILYSGPQGQDI